MSDHDDDAAFVERGYKAGLIRHKLAANGVDAYNQLAEYKAALAQNEKSLNKLVMVMIDQLDRGGDREWQMAVMLIAMWRIRDGISLD